MNDVAASALLDDLDGLNSTRALILQAYYGLRRAARPPQIGTREIVSWIERCEPNETLPSESLILLTLKQAAVLHRGPGRPRGDSHVGVVDASPLLRNNRPLQ